MHCCPKPVIFPKHVLAPNSSNQSNAMKQSQQIRHNKYTPLPVVNTMGETGPTGPTGSVIIIAGATGPIGITGPTGMNGVPLPPTFTNIQQFDPISIPANVNYTVMFTMNNFVYGKYIILFNSRMTFSTGPQSVDTEMYVSYNGFINDHVNSSRYVVDTCKVLTEHTMNLCNYTGIPPSIVISNLTDSPINLDECFVVFVYLNS